MCAQKSAGLVAPIQNEMSATVASGRDHLFSLEPKELVVEINGLFVPRFLADEHE